MRELSVIIPARNEMFLQQTISNVLENIEADTEIIVICDGGWPDPPVMDHERVVVIHHTVPIGQRAATNEGARVSQAKYIMKLDAHCAVDKGFDKKLIEGCQHDWTLVPAMYNLHAFNWVCSFCGKETYQGKKPTSCSTTYESPGIVCANEDEFEMKIIWKPKPKHLTLSWRFDKNLQFQYWQKHRKRPETRRGNYIETMSFIGACWFMERERYWELDGLDEAHGIWGQVGTEMACKTWLSGGKLLTCKKTWFAHLFRTGNFKGAFGGGSSFPYPLPQSQIDHARKHSQDMWLNNKWPKAIYPLDWLVEKFRPIPDWHE